MSNWQDRFDRLLKAMSQGEPHKAGKATSSAQSPAKCQEIEQPAPPADKN
jgi:hypothetical protein